MAAPDKAKLDSLSLSGSFAVLSRSTDFAASVGNYYRVNTSSGNVTATLEAPSSSNAGQDVSFKKLSATGTLTIASTALIDGETSIAVTIQQTSVTLRSTGSTWDVV